MQGQVIGVATLQVAGGQSVNFAIPSERIAQLDRTRSHKRAGDVARLNLSAPPAATNARAPWSSSAMVSRFFRKTIARAPLPYFQKATDADNAYAEAWAQMGFCHEKLGRHNEAIERSKKAVSIRPSAESYFNIGLANYYLKQYREAEAAYRQSINSILTTQPMLLCARSVLSRRRPIRR
jgi:tetratricopeptide (TPR) repeat protein